MTSTDKPIHMTSKEYYDLLQKTRREALEEAAKTQCPHCAKNRKIGKNSEGVFKHIDIDGDLLTDCYADDIHELIATDKGQDQTTQAEPVERYEGELGTLEHLNWLDTQITKAVENIGTEED